MLTATHKKSLNLFVEKFQDEGDFRSEGLAIRCHISDHNISVCEIRNSRFTETSEFSSFKPGQEEVATKSYCSR